MVSLVLMRWLGEAVDKEHQQESGNERKTDVEVRRFGMFRIVRVGEGWILESDAVDGIDAFGYNDDEGGAD